MIDLKNHPIKSVQELRQLFQEYIDESSLESDNFLTGLDVTEPALVASFNDFLLFMSQCCDPVETFEPVTSNLPTE